MADTTLTTTTPFDLLSTPFSEILRWPLAPFLAAPEGFPLRLEELTEDGHLVVKAELPGIDPEKDVHITVEDDVLVIEGERRSEVKKDEKGRHFSEMRYGSFMRRVPLPEGTKVKEITASYRDGILEVRFPKPVVTAAKAPTRIAVAH